MVVRDNYIMNGAVVAYEGNEGKIGIVAWSCDATVPSGQIKFREHAYLEGQSLAFAVSSSDVCASGSGPTPSPPPRVIPPDPVPTQTPTPIPSPQAMYYLGNDTHCVLVNLQNLQGVFPARGPQDITVAGQEGMLLTVWNAWDRTPCPWGWDCRGFDRANLWECWRNATFHEVCYPVADKHVHGFALTSDDFGGSVLIHYPGQWGTVMRVNVICDRFRPRDSLPILESVVQVDGGIYLFNVRSALSCPRRSSDGYVPTHPRSLPSGPIEQVDEIEGFAGGMHYGLKLKKLMPAQGEIFAEESTTVYKRVVHFSPYTLRGCPKKGRCGIYENEQANVWSCVNDTNPICFPIGDKRYNLTMGFLDPSVKYSGVWAHYSGGADDYRVTFHFYCDLNLKRGDLELYTVGQQDRNHVTVHAHTLRMCTEAGYGQLNGGAVFLLIVVIASLLYFGCGTIVIFFLEGTVSVPNEAFWVEVWDSIVTALTFIFSCGKEGSGVVYDRV
jgi:hypothetical protein